MITSEEPKVSDNGRYTIMQVCAALGIHRNTLRRYCSQGKIRFLLRKADSRKVFLGSDIKRLWRVAL